MRFEWGETGELFPLREGPSETAPENQAIPQEMSEFMQYAAEQPQEDIRISEGGFSQEGRFIPGRVEWIDAEAAEFDPELQALSEELDSWFQQSERMSCAVADQTMVLNQLTHEGYTEQEMLDIGREKGWYNEGTYPKDVGKIAEHMGMEVEQHHGVAAAELDIANDPELKVLANVDSALLQYPGAFKRCQPDHCVQVLRVDDTAEGKMVILNDPGHADGKGVVYPLEVFERAYRGDITTIRKAEMA